MAAERASPQVKPPAAFGQAFDAPGSAGGRRGIDDVVGHGLGSMVVRGMGVDALRRQASARVGGARRGDAASVRNARVVHFLAADAYITDQPWAVNGGQDM